MEKIIINTDQIKLDSFLKLTRKVSTGGEAKLLISSGKVKVNDKTCKSRGKKLKLNDVIEIENQKFTVAEQCD